MALIPRVRLLARLKVVTDELRMRALTSSDIGIQSPERDAVSDTGRNASVLIVDDRPGSYERIAATLKTEHEVDVEPDPTQALFHAADRNYDLVIVSLGLVNFDALRLCSQLRSLARTCNLPILAVTEPDNTVRMARGLEIGVNVICCARSTRTSSWRGCAPKCASAAIPSGCATVSRYRSKCRSRMRSPACPTAAIWKAIWRP